MVLSGGSRLAWNKADISSCSVEFGISIHTAWTEIHIMKRTIWTIFIVIFIDVILITTCRIFTVVAIVHIKVKGQLVRVTVSQ